uniref:Uncharacterized protein n=1 Tax=Bicosoecida sp. CB-2014 TaxID=1486930 RepID=A0A7S1CBV7_9STRA
MRSQGVVLAAALRREFTRTVNVTVNHGAVVHFYGPCTAAHRCASIAAAATHTTLDPPHTVPPALAPRRVVRAHQVHVQRRAPAERRRAVRAAIHGRKVLIKASAVDERRE